MSVVEVFPGDEAAVRSLRPDENPSGRVDIGSVDLPQLARLFETLSHRPVADPSMAFPQVRALGKDGPFVHRLPAELRDSLTFLGTYGILDCAAGWSGAGGGESRLNSDQLRDVLGRLVDLANSAKTRGKDLFVWRHD